MSEECKFTVEQAQAVIRVPGISPYYAELKAACEEILHPKELATDNRLKEITNRLYMCLGSYLDYCTCGILYKCYDPHDAMREYVKYKKEVQDE